MPAAATAVAVPEPKPPIIAPMTTSGTEPVSAAQPYPATARSSPIRAGLRSPYTSTRPASENPAVAELNSSALPTRPAWAALRPRWVESLATRVGSR